jgi:hypothetical protein
MIPGTLCQHWFIPPQKKEDLCLMMQLVIFLYCFYSFSGLYFSIQGDLCPGIDSGELPNV